MTETGNPLHRLALFAGLALMLAACYGSADQQAQTPESGKAAAEKSPAQVPARKSLSTNEQIAYSIKDLATRLAIDPADVGFSGATSVMWRSGAIGCPEPGMSYTEALVNGVWIMLRAGDAIYRYHAVTGGEPFYCPDERAEPPVMGPGAD